MRKVQLILIVIVAILASNVLQAQKHKLGQEKSIVTISGTSTLHDWEMSCGKLEGDALIKFDKSHKIIELNNLTFRVIVSGMESGKSLMDNKTYDALKEKEHPKITYSLTDVTAIKATANGDYNITANGTLSIAGVTKRISQKVTANISGNEVVFSGKHELDMTTYDVTPPTAIMGTIKTGKQITIYFKTTFSIN